MQVAHQPEGQLNGTLWHGVDLVYFKFFARFLNNFLERVFLASFQWPWGACQLVSLELVLH